MDVLSVYARKPTLFYTEASLLHNIAMIRPGDIISHGSMCAEEGMNLQRGMNYRAVGGLSIFLMSTRRGAPYADRVEDEGKTLIYEGHDIPQVRGGVAPKTVDQVAASEYGTPTQNGLFFAAAMKHLHNGAKPLLVKVYEKIKSGIWVYNGVFELLDAWQADSGGRKVFKFRLSLVEEEIPVVQEVQDLAHTRMIPSKVKQEVYARDKGRCVLCGSDDNIHYDHILPFSKGGSSLTAENIQILCARHNLQKSARII